MLEKTDEKIRVAETVTSTMIEVMRVRGLDPQGVVPEAKLADTLGLKSMDLAEIVLILEDELEIDPFQTIPITTIRTVGNLVDAYLVSLGLAEAAAAPDMASEMAAAKARRGGRRR